MHTYGTDGDSGAEIGSVFAFLTEVHCQLHLYMDRASSMQGGIGRSIVKSTPEKNRQSIERTRKRIDVTGRANVEWFSRVTGRKNTKEQKKGEIENERTSGECTTCTRK